MKRQEDGTISFDDFPEFTPNKTPKEMLSMGIFGGSYFRPITSGVTGLKYKNRHKLLPSEWIEGLDEDKYICSSVYRQSVNYYKKRCGSDQAAWESKGWIKSCDPYGWFQWYCRFYEGRRTDDDERQIKRWMGVAGPNGRFRRRLANLCKSKSKAYDDFSVSPVIRQTLLHWGYELTKADLSG